MHQREIRQSGSHQQLLTKVACGWVIRKPNFHENNLHVTDNEHRVTASVGWSPNSDRETCPCRSFRVAVIRREMVPENINMMMYILNDLNTI